MRHGEKANTVSVKDLTRLLEERGCVETVFPESHRLYTHRTSGAELLLPLNAPPAL